MEPDRTSMDAPAIHSFQDAPQIRDDNGATRSAALSNPQRRTRSLYIVFAFLAGLYLLPFMRIMLPHSNEGTLIYGADRILHGDVFARDFFEVMGPGSFYIVACFFRAFGETFLATRIWLFFSSLGIAICLFFLARRICPRNAVLPCLIVAGTWFGMQWPSVSHHVDSDLFSLLSVVCLVVWSERRNSIMLYASGASAGLTACIHQPKGFLLILSLLAWCACRRIPGGSMRVTSGRILLGFVAVIVSVGGYFATQGALGPLLYANTTWPTRNYTAINTVPYAMGIFSEYWHHWAALKGNVDGWPVALASVLIIPFVFIASIPVLLILFSPGVRSARVTPGMLLCLLTGWAVWLSEIHRMDIYHLAFGCPLLLVVCIGLLDAFEGRIMRLSLQCLSIAAGCLMLSNLLQTVTARTIPTRVGPVAMLRPEPVLPFIDAHTTPGEEVFFYPYDPHLYFLSQTKNPTRYSILVYKYNTPAEFQEVIENLEQKHVRFVVWDSTFYDRTFKAVFPQESPVPPNEQVIEKYFQSRYIQIANLEGLRILLRKV